MLGTKDLQNKLMKKDFETYISEEARLIDETIFYYVEKQQIHLSTIELKKILLKELI